MTGQTIKNNNNKSKIRKKTQTTLKNNVTTNKIADGIHEALFKISFRIAGIVKYFNCRRRRKHSVQSLSYRFHVKE